MVSEVGKRLTKDYSESNYNKGFNQAFTAFPKDAGFNNRLSAPQPTSVEGVTYETIANL